MSQVELNPVANEMFMVKKYRDEINKLISKIDPFLPEDERFSSEDAARFFSLHKMCPSICLDICAKASKLFGAAILFGSTDFIYERDKEFEEYNDLKQFFDNLEKKYST